MNVPDCLICDGTGWAMCLDADGESGYWTACPDGCPQTIAASPAATLDDEEVPF